MENGKVGIGQQLTFASGQTRIGAYAGRKREELFGSPIVSDQIFVKEASDPLRLMSRRFRIQIGKQHYKLFPGVPCNHGGRAEYRHKHLRKALKQAVAFFVSVELVVESEIVKIEEYKCYLVGIFVKHLSQPPTEGTTVQKTREHVYLRFALQLFVQQGVPKGYGGHGRKGF